MNQRRYRLAALALATLGGLVIWTIANEVFPYHSLNHDEGVYLQQAAMLLEGQVNLWPPLEDVFHPWFFVKDGGRLYPKYSPVPSAMFAVGQLLGGYRLALLGIAAGNIALVIGIVTEIADRPTGVLAGTFVLASPLFLIDSSVFLPYAPTTFLNLLFGFAYLRADRTAEPRWAALAGIAVGLAFFARPYTAVLFAIPFIAHALWTLYVDWEAALQRQLLIAGLGLLGVVTALGYNLLMTGSPWVFPYQAFAPLDGLGFGHRELLNHEIRYTPELALRANQKVVSLFFREWIAGGILGAGLAVLGLATVVKDGPSAREATIASLFGTVIVGNVYFWGNFNILGVLERPGDGLVTPFGPYYHFDLLLPTAAFAAIGIVWAGRRLRDSLEGRVEPRYVPAALAIVALLSTGAIAGVTVADVDERLEENLEATRTYEDVYEPFDGGPPANSVILLPDPYGDWLNHPFQPLRNDPGFDGRAVYAVNDHPFAVVNEFPDRDTYRFVYRGGWAPYAGSPEDGYLQRVRSVSGDRVRLATQVGIPDGAIGVTARISTDEGSVYYVTRNISGSLGLNLTITDGTVEAAGDFRPVSNKTLSIEGRDDVVITVFVDYGPGGGFAYRFDLPVLITDGTMQVLSPRIERCRYAQACGGAAAYIPAAAPPDIFVRSQLVALEPNS